ncbi:MAG: hypothetical protein ACYDHH_31425 [Solirubrobacteraceae bacterium]
MTSITDAGATIDLDWAAPWEHLVAESLRAGRAAAAAAAALGLPPGTVVTADWIDQTDV